MSDEPQLSLLTADGDARVWTCPTCAGTGRRQTEAGQELERCRVCDGTGRVTWDPLDRTFGF